MVMLSKKSCILKKHFIKNYFVIRLKNICQKKSLRLKKYLAPFAKHKTASHGACSFVKFILSEILVFINKLQARYRMNFPGGVGMYWCR
jgi:hypothetical protein